MQWMNPAAYAIPTTAGAGATFNWMDPNAWAQMMTPPQGGAQGTQGQAFFNPFDPNTWMPQTQPQTAQQ